MKNPQTVRGQPEDPMTLDEVMFKARGLIEPVLGAARTEKLLETLAAIDALPNIRALRPLLQQAL